LRISARTIATIVNGVGSVALTADSHPTSKSPFDSIGHVIAQFLCSLQRSLDPDNLHLASRDLSGRFAMTARSHQAALVARSIRRKIGTALFFGCACAQPRQINPFRARNFYLPFCSTFLVGVAYTSATEFCEFAHSLISGHA
jgi:hypothetical protein